MTTPIIRQIVNWLLPFMLLFSFYLMLFGHLSPGGGFSGGSVLGASLILDRFVNEKRSIGARLTGELLLKAGIAVLGGYALLKGQSFLFGVLHMQGLPVFLGTPGHILSGGFLVPLNLAIGILVGFVFYLIAVLFEEGRL